jgi:hypothetical protein
MADNINVYRLNEYEWWATKLSLGAFIGWYDKNIETIDDPAMIEDITICDIEKDCMYDTGSITFEDEAQYGKAVLKKETERYAPTAKQKLGNVVFMHGELMKYVTFKTVLEQGYKNEPFMICGTEA